MEILASGFPRIITDWTQIYDELISVPYILAFQAFGFSYSDTQIQTHIHMHT